MMVDKAQFSIYRRPGSVVFIDEEHDYLEMIGMVMPTQWQVELFSRPQTCLAYFDEAVEEWTTDLHEQQKIIDKWHQGSPLIPQVLKYWHENTERYALPRVLVADYSMPAMNGLALIERLNEWTGSCVLLSGRADEHIAVDAFNRGLLEQFIPKQTPDITRKVIDTVAQLLEMPNPTQDQFWRSTLSSAQQMALRRPVVASALRKYAASHWVESVILGSPFGILGMDKHGKLSWLQMEFSENLAELAELVCLQPVPKRVQAHLIAIRAGTYLTDVELQQSMGMIDCASVEPAFHVGTTELLGAIFQLDKLPKGILQPMGYEAWHSRQNLRSIRD